MHSPCFIPDQIRNANLEIRTKSEIRNPKSGSGHAGVPAAGERAFPTTSSIAGWTVHHYQQVTSTNLIAAALPAWEAVRADTQSAGRGRFERTWVSDDGGLWLSAVVPTGPDASVVRALPLLAGLAVCDALRAAGIRPIRLRWPNDILVNDLKLAGLLVDQFTPGLAVIGMGINVLNRPEARDATLKNLTTRLADWLFPPPGVPELTGLLLSHLRLVVTELKHSGLNALLPRLNDCWGGPRRVELELDGLTCRGLFSGIDAEARLVLTDESGTLAAYAAHQVRHLKEI